MTSGMFLSALLSAKVKWVASITVHGVIRFNYSRENRFLLLRRGSNHRRENIIGLFPGKIEQNEWDYRKAITQEYHLCSMSSVYFASAKALSVSVSVLGVRTACATVFTSQMSLRLRCVPLKQLQLCWIRSWLHTVELVLHSTVQICTSCLVQTPRGNSRCQPAYCDKLRILPTVL